MGAVRESPAAVASFAEVADRFARGVAAADLRAPVPSCPGWTVRDLVLHLGNVHAWAATVVETRRSARVGEDEPRSGRARAMSEWYAAKAEDLHAVLRATPHDDPCWSFARRADVVGFWPRRQLHETVVHQVDLDLAAGRGADATAVPPAVAADGVDEVLTVFLPRAVTRGATVPLDGTLLLTADDTADHWRLAPPLQVERLADAPDDIAARVVAPAAVLHRLLWGRESLEHPEVEVSGSEAVAHDFVTSRFVP